MRAIGIVAVALLAGAVLPGCGIDLDGADRTVTGSGRVVGRDILVSSFSEIEVSTAFVVTVDFGSSEKVTVRVDDNVVNDLDVEVSGDTLRIALRSGVSVRDATLEADVTARSLSRIEGSGAVRITLGEPLTGEELDVTLSGASALTGELTTVDATMELSGAASADLAGSVSDLEITASGASELSGLGLTIDELTIDLSGASQATVTVTGSISVVATGASSLRYAGTPTFERQDVSGGSQIAPIG